MKLLAVLTPQSIYHVLTLPRHGTLDNNLCVPNPFSPGRHDLSRQFYDQVCLRDHPGMIPSQRNSHGTFE